MKNLIAALVLSSSVVAFAAETVANTGMTGEKTTTEKVSKKKSKKADKGTEKTEKTEKTETKTE